MCSQTWFQDELGGQLIQYGIGRDADDRRRMRRTSTTRMPETPPVTPVPASASTVTIPTTDRVQNTRSRSMRKRRRGPGRKRKRSAGGRPKSLPVKTTTIHTPISLPSITPLFTPPPFVPKRKGRRSTPMVVSSGCILIKGAKHTLRSDLPFMPRNSTCKICYLTNSRSKRVTGCKGRTLDIPRRTIYACDKCKRMLCPVCFRKQSSHGSSDSVRSILLIE